MKTSEIRAMDDAALVEKLDELKTEWRDLRFDEAIGQLTNPMRIQQIKRDVARIKTIQTERQLQAQYEQAATS